MSTSGRTFEGRVYSGVFIFLLLLVFILVEGEIYLHPIAGILSIAIILATFQCQCKKKLNLSGYSCSPCFLFDCDVSEIGQVRKTLGENIRCFRKQARLTQEQLAEKADLHPVYVSQVEGGYKAVSVEAVWKISKALKVPISSLFRGI